MSVDRIHLLRNLGQFESVSAGAQIAFAKLTLVYAENGRGKTTLAAVFRSMLTNDPVPLLERQRLGSRNPPHVVLGVAGAQLVFQSGVWSAAFDSVAVFDDSFVAANVCSGIEIAPTHRQNLHELILGTQGVALNATLQGHVDRIEVHNRDMRLKEDAIPPAARGSLTVDAFCALPADPDIAAKIAAAERELAAARAADAIRQHAAFRQIALPAFDRAGITGLLAQTVPDLEAAAASRVMAHFARLGQSGETWVAGGMGRIPGTSGPQDHSICPFCAQDLGPSQLIQHYQAYFSDAYKALTAQITQVGREINTIQGGEAPAAFERSMRVAAQDCEFWRAFTDVPHVTIDTAAVTRAWIAARDAVLTVLRAKAASPLEAMTLNPTTLTLIDTYDGHRQAIEMFSLELQARNDSIALVKERAAAANVAALASDITRLKTVQQRHAEPVATQCKRYLAEKAAKTATETLRDRARATLDNYRQNIFPAYEAAINTYLRRFNAGFRLSSVSSVNNRGGSSCTYNVLINHVAVSLTADTGPSFRNTLSAGDRNTLALAFFFASLYQDPDVAQKVVVIDDPMTSFDAHRTLATIQEIRQLISRVEQVIVLSHTKSILCDLWEGADKAGRAAIEIRRDGTGSTLAAWDVRQDCITEHDRRHELVDAYLYAGDPTKEREVAAALRPMLEQFVRVAYPMSFPPGSLLGPFLGICAQRVGTAEEILSQVDITELRSLLDYANRFHHDTNPAYATAVINDQELTHYCKKTLEFARRA